MGENAQDIWQEMKLQLKGTEAQKEELACISNELLALTEADRERKKEPKIADEIKYLTQIHVRQGEEIEHDNKLEELAKRAEAVYGIDRNSKTKINQLRISSMERLKEINEKLLALQRGLPGEPEAEINVTTCVQKLEALKAQQPPAPTPPEQNNPLQSWKLVGKSNEQFKYEKSGQDKSTQYSGTVYTTKSKSRVESNNGLKGCIRTLIAHNIMTPESCQDITYNKEYEDRMANVMSNLGDVINAGDATDQEKIEAKRLLAALTKQKEHSDYAKLETETAKHEAKREPVISLTRSTNPTHVAATKAEAAQYASYRSYKMLSPLVGPEEVPSSGLG